MSNAERPTSMKRLVNKNGKTYKSTISWRADSPNSNLAATSNKQKKVLRELLSKLKMKKDPAAYRIHAAGKKTYPIVELDKGHYRIDNQLRLNLNDPMPRLNIHYQVGDLSHAMVLVRMRPVACPLDITIEELVDENPDFGFSHDIVMGFIEDALMHSAANQCYTYIEWTIEEVGSDSSPAGSGSGNNLVYNALNVVAEAAASHSAKTAVKVLTKATVKHGAEMTMKQGSKSVLKNVPVIGLAVGLAFGFDRLTEGDLLGAFGEVVSGFVSCLPGGGTAASIGIDIVLLARDFENKRPII